MNEEQFKAHFIASFMATHAANRYEEYCQQGWQWRLENHPIEDAADLAGSAWEKYLQHSPTKHSERKEVRHG